jgi:hypothetical protein
MTPRNKYFGISDSASIGYRFFDDNWLSKNDKDILYRIKTTGSGISHAKKKSPADPHGSYLPAYAAKNEILHRKLRDPEAHLPCRSWKRIARRWSKSARSRGRSIRKTTMLKFENPSAANAGHAKSNFLNPREPKCFTTP